MSKLRTLTALVGAVALLVACTDNGDDVEPSTETEEEDEATAEEDEPAAEPADGEPIIVGAVSTLTGPATFPESHAAAQAVFDRVNAQGGIDGRPIEYVVEDDGFDPANASQAARRLVESEGVVAMVGSASLLECAVNGSFYAESDVYAIQGTGIDPLCFRSSNIAPVNTGPFFGNSITLYYASEDLGYDNICFGAFDIPDFQSAYDQAIDAWSDLTGGEIIYRDTTLPLEGDLTPFMLSLENNGCDAAVVQANDFHYVSMMGIRAAQGLDVQILGLTSGYTEEVAEELGATGDGFIVAAEFEPFTGDSPALDEWREAMEEGGVPRTSLAQGGYLAATIFVDALHGIDGEITRESVSEALVGIEDYMSELIGNPFTFGDEAAHQPNRSAKFVELLDGAWQPVSEDWITLPEGS